MAIVFSEQKKKQQNLILVFILVILATSLVIWLGVFKKPKNSQEPSFSFSQKIAEIDFRILESPIFSELKLSRLVPAFKGETGRDNPYLPLK